MKEIVDVCTLDDYKLKLTFNNGEIRVKDMKPHLDKGIFKILKDKSVFSKVKINFGTVSWDNDIDMCADFLYETSVPIE